MLDKCCCCIGLRTATLILATISAFWNFSNAYRVSLVAGQVSGTFYFFVSTYCMAAGLASFAGLIGVLKNKAQYVKVFAFYYWFQLAWDLMMSILLAVVMFHYDRDICREVVQDPDVDMDEGECMEWFTQAAIAIVAAMSVSCLIELHYAMAIWSYYKRLCVEQQYRDIQADAYNVYYTRVPAYTVVPPPAYENLPDPAERPTVDQKMPVRPFKQ